jgi:hypothetical protein
MKTCAYCTTKNRDETIFCTRCKRPLQAVPRPKESSPTNILTWLLVAVILIGLSYYFFSSRWFNGPNTPTHTPPSAMMPITGPVPTRTQEPMTISACVSGAMIKIRRGPGTQYETTGGLASGTCLVILGRNEEATWVYMVSEDHKTGWVAASLLPNAGNLSRVSVRDPSRMAKSAQPTLTSAEIAHGAQVYLTQVAETNIPKSSLSKYAVPCLGLANRVGDHISCKMERAYCDYLPVLEGGQTLCSDRPAPDHTFTLMVSGEDWSDLDGRCLIVSGYLEINKGMLQIQALSRDQVSFCD